MYIATIYDTETNGKPLKYKAAAKDVKNWPRITQLAWENVEVNTGEVLESHSYLVKPDGWVIPKEQFFIENGMSTERCMEHGLPIAQVLDIFMASLLFSHVLVAHNENFDRPVIGAEMIRAGKRSPNILPGICTMLSTTDLLKLPGKYGHKYPTLAELHHYLFKQPFQGAHDAGFDVAATRTCFLELVRRKLISLPAKTVNV